METNLSPEVLSETIKSLINSLECPVCHKLPKAGRWKQCNSGHVLCEECTENRVHCVELNCRQQFLKKEPLVYRQLLEVCPRKCENNGCSSSITLRNNHACQCVFSETICQLCPQYSCSRHELLDHLNCTHSQSIVSVNYIKFTVNGLTGDVEKDTQSVQQSMQSCGAQIASGSCVIYFYTLKNIFWLTLKHSIQDNSLKFESFVVPLGFSSVKADFLCSFEIIGQKGGSLIYSKLMKKGLLQNNCTISADFNLEKEILCEFLGDTLLRFIITFSKSEDSKPQHPVDRKEQSTSGCTEKKNKSEGGMTSPRKKFKASCAKDSEGRLGLTVEEMKEVMSDILQVMKCAGCLKLPKLNSGGTPHQCRKSHVVCSLCRESLQNCPSCGSPFIIKSPSLYIKVLHVLQTPKV